MGHEISYQILLSLNFPPTVEVAVSQPQKPLGCLGKTAALQHSRLLCTSQEAKAMAGQGYLSTEMISCPGAST